ncbi:MAG: DUF262 domain-containing protein [Planctomycetota bacterium]|nr:DUF262 domain-containing protein [Planctomycetota bacterium]
MNELRTVFKQVGYALDGLLHYIDVGDIGLPEIQRPFVWPATKVRDLFDSMYKGFPVGYLLFWSNASGDGARQIGLDDKAHKAPALLIVDGQQRLTSLYAVFRGKPIMDENYQTRRIEIAFRPRDGKFEVCDAATRKDPEFIPDISVMWSSGSSSHKLVKTFLKQLGTKRELTEDEEESISHNLDRLFDLQKFPFTALEIASSVDEEHVADIFVRINSEGVKLNQADFILTLLSVFGEDLRVAFERFSRASRTVPTSGSGPSPYNHFISVAPDQLLRVSVAVGFNRGRLKSIYQVLRGKDPDTEQFSPALRDKQFARLRESQTSVLNLTHWHRFFNALIGAGFRSGELVSSQNALLYAYAFYLIGKTRHNVPDHELERLIGRWFYATSLSGRYTSSPETIMDGDLNLTKEAGDGAAFVAVLSKLINDTLTSDFWTIALPNDLETSAARSPSLFAYYAAQNVLKAPVLFSKKRIPDLLDPTLQTKKKALDRHHLFPRACLESQGVEDLKVINQAANFALLEWPDNIDISDTPPAEYVPKMKARFTSVEWEEMSRMHALPDNWDNMPYLEFLQKRRALMAQIVKQGYETL